MERRSTHAPARYGLMFGMNYPAAYLRGHLVRVERMTDDRYHLSTDIYDAPEYLTSTLENCDAVLNGVDTATQDTPSRQGFIQEQIDNIVIVKVTDTTEHTILHDRLGNMSGVEFKTLRQVEVLDMNYEWFVLTERGTTRVTPALIAGAVFADTKRRSDAKNAHLVYTDKSVSEISTLLGKRVFVNTTPITLIAVNNVPENLAHHLGGRKGLMLFSKAGTHLL